MTKRWRCKSRVLYIASDAICPFPPCEIEIKENPNPPLKGYNELTPRGCLFGAVYQEWERIADDEKREKDS